MPEEWLVSQICQSFGIPPELGGVYDQPFRLVMDILEMRAYVRARDLMLNATEDDEVPDWASTLYEDVRREFMALIKGRIQKPLRFEDGTDCG